MITFPPFPKVPLSAPTRFAKTLRTYLDELPEHFLYFDGDVEEQLLLLLNNLLGLDFITYRSRLSIITEVKFTCPKPPRSEAVCKKKFGPDDQGFTCLDCFPDKKAKLCASCFDVELHFKHQTTFGNNLHMTDLYCRCGDPGVSLGNLGCSQHTVEPIKAPDSFNLLPPKICARLTPLVRVLLDFIIDVFRCSLQLQQNYSDTVSKDKKQINYSIWGAYDRERSSSKVMMRLWDDHFINLDELISVFKQKFSYNDPQAIIQVKMFDDAGKFEFPVDLNTFPINSTRTEFNSRNIGVSFHSKQMVFLENIASTCLWFLTLISGEDAETSLDGHFSPLVRQVLANQLLRPAALFTKTVDVRSFNENITVSSLYQVSDLLESPSSFETFVATRALLDQIDVTLMSPELLKRFEDVPLETSTFNYHFPQPNLKKSTRIATLPRTRLDWLLKLSPTFWKQMRGRLQTVLLSALKVPKVKPSILLHIAINYPSLAQLFQYRIIESDNPHSRFWMDMISDQHLSVVIVRDLQFLRHLLSSLEKVLLGTVTPPEVYGCSFLPPEKKFIFKTKFLKNSQFNFMIFSLRRVLKCSSLVKLIAYDHIFHAQFVHFLSAFHGMNLVSLKKIKAEDRGLSLHNGSATMSYHLRELITFVVNILKTNPLMVIRAIRHTLRKIWAVMESEKKPTWDSPRDQAKNQDAPPDDSTVSYYCILHFYLVKLLECPQLHDPTYINKLGFTNLLHLLLGHKNHDIENHSVKKLLAIFNYPIKTLALLSRAQFHANPKKKISSIQQVFDVELYKEVVSYCYLVQIMLCIFHPEQALETIITTYGLQNWSNPSLIHSVYTNQEYFYMAGDFIKLLLHCFTVRDDFANSDFDTKIIKTLALYIFQPKEHAFLMQVLPQWLTHSPHYIRSLANLTGFSFSPQQLKEKFPPFKLNKESALWLNPYHYLIKQNDFLEARSVRRSRDEPVYYDLHFPPFPTGTYQNLWSFLHSPLLTKFIFYTLLHIKLSKSNQQVLADYVLQLFTVARAEYCYCDYSRESTPRANIWTSALVLTFPLDGHSEMSCFDLLNSMNSHPSFKPILKKYDDVIDSMITVGKCHSEDDF